MKDLFLSATLAIVATALILFVVIAGPTVIGLWIMACLFLAPVVLAIVHIAWVVYDSFTTI